VDPVDPAPDPQYRPKGFRTGTGTDIMGLYPFCFLSGPSGAGGAPRPSEDGLLNAWLSRMGGHPPLNTGPPAPTAQAGNNILGSLQFLLCVLMFITHVACETITRVDLTWWRVCRRLLFSCVFFSCFYFFSSFQLEEEETGGQCCGSMPLNN
jgi:hypothetical protein